MNWGGHWRILAWAAEVAVDADASCFEALLEGIRAKGHTMRLDPDPPPMLPPGPIGPDAGPGEPY